MGRQRKVSDEDILRAAQRVMAARGVEAFTLTEVAHEVGVSRAAISLRFSSVEELRLRMAEYGLRHLQREIAALPAARSGDSLIALATLMGALTPSLSAMTLMTLDGQRAFRNESMAPIAQGYLDLVRGAIAARMPDTGVPLDDAVDAFLTHTSGAVMAWSDPDVCPADYMAEHTKIWLKLARIPFQPRQDHTSFVAGVRGRTPYLVGKS